MNQHQASGSINRLIGRLLLTGGRVVSSHRMIRAGRYYCRLGNAQATMADARAIIRRCMRRAETVSIPHRHAGQGGVVSIR